MTTDNRLTYGGQAVIEGVLIRGQRCASVAVRRPNGTIAHRTDPINPFFTGLFRRVPLVRGIIALIEMLSLGMRSLVYSANVGIEEEEEEIGKGTMAAVITFSLLTGIGLFFLVPVLIISPLEGVLGSDIASNFAEGVIRLSIFLTYIWAIGKMKQIHRVFMYHGAEHMTVHAQEHGDPLEIDIVRRYPKAHPRCGTAFLLIVVIVAALVFSFVGRDPLWWLITSRIVLVPFVAALSYEIVRFSGFHSENILVKFFAAPSLLLQSMTTNNPDDDQIEVAITAMEQAISGDAKYMP